MSRLMPGRIRQEGIDLYDAGKLAVEKIEEKHLQIKVDTEVFSYALDDRLLACTCTLFAQKGYCAHLAATEYFLRNDTEGQKFLQDLSEETESQVELVRRTYFGGQFLDQVLRHTEVSGVKFRLAVQGQLLLYDSNIDWTLKIGRLPDNRFYVVRDIGAFLKQVKNGGSYQIGKNYYEPIHFEQFDEASQDVICFLWKLTPQKPGLDNDILVHFGRHLRLPQAYLEEGITLFEDLAEFQFDYQSQSYSHLEMQLLTGEAGLFRFDVQVHTKMIEMVIAERAFRELFNGAFLLDKNILYCLDWEQEGLVNLVKELVPTESGQKKVQIDFQDQERLALSLLDLQKIGQVHAPKRFKIEDFRPAFFLDMLENGEISLELVLQFSNRQVQTWEQLEALPFTVHAYHLEHLFSLLDQGGFARAFQSTRSSLKGEALYHFFKDWLPRLRELGQVDLSEELQQLWLQESPQVTINRQGSLLDIAFDFQGITESEIGLALQALMEDRGYFASQSGRLLVFDEETKKISQTLQNLRAQYGSDGHLSVQAVKTYGLLQNIQDKSNVHLSADFRQLAQDLARPEQYPLPPLQLEVGLRDYQQLGVKWLSMLDKYGFGGILADDMGLGKTLQTIAFLVHQLKEESKVLILAPSSLIYNWQDECQRFAPQLDVAVAYGNKESRERMIAERHQILVTSYASFRQDSDLYRQQAYDYLILDEAQVMKNAQTKIAQLLRDFQVGNCFALSGTPIENHLSELWSIFQIVLPGLLPNKQEFSKLEASEVARLIQPFVLRRRKEDVLQELPDLTETNVLNELTEDQKVIYLAQLRQMQSSVGGATDAEINRKKIEILAGITRLRQICDTPSLFMEDYQGSSGKLDSLKELLLQLKEGGHRVLIFSQFRTMLERIGDLLTEMDMSFYQLTGSTPAGLRQEMTQAFNAGSRDAFLISLKAGGVGLNLTGADTVILVDLWWNPAVESQAISRAHRMGQTEKVECYRLITRGTIEEKIQALQEDKKNLVTTILDGEETRATMTVEDIRAILGIN